METIRKYVDKIIEFICISFVGIMTTLVTWQVITRYFLKNPSPVTEQISKYMFVWLVLLGSAYVFGKREHMSMVFIKEKFKGRGAVTVDIIVEIIVIVFALGILVIGGYKNTLLTMNQSDSALPITIGMIYVILPISGIITMFYGVCNIINILKGSSKEKALKTE